ncbi:paraquat-inducible protein A [Glycocaulis sp.]
MDGRADPHGNGGALARGLIALGLVLFPPGIFLPMLETTRFLVLTEQYSLLDTLAALLAARELGLFLLIGLFSVGTPLLKAAILILVHRLPAEQITPYAMRAIELLGKWSLTDVLVVAIFIVLWSSGPFMGAASLPGLWFFAASAVSLMLASGVIARDVRAALPVSG